jgi:hypothetical protein
VLPLALGIATVVTAELRGLQMGEDRGKPLGQGVMDLAGQPLALGGDPVCVVGRSEVGPGALELGDELGVPLPQGSSTHNLQRLARGMKLGSSDSSSILRVYETALGRTVKP